MSNPKVKNYLIESYGIEQSKVSLLEWGVDVEFYKSHANESGKQDVQFNLFFLSSGKTLRDYNTLCQAFVELNVGLEIFCSQNSQPDIPYFDHSNINITVNPNSIKEGISLVEPLSKYRKAYGVAIPLYENKGLLVGLTSLLDAMAMGKAIIMTRNDFINIDIEKQGIGIWVNPGDVEGWKRAVNYLISHPYEALEMGRKAKELCEEKYNIESFSVQLANQLRHVVARVSQKKISL
jgi:glycosyltransferase involved in cell wall biosynthesis